MTENPIVSATYGPTTLTTPPEAVKTWRDRTVAWLAFIRSLMINAVIIGSIVAILVVTVLDLMRQPVIIEEIHLPGSLEDRGYSGTVAAHRLWDQILDIQEKSKTNKHQASVLAETRQLDVVEPGTGISPQGLSRMLRATLGFKQTRIAGEIICADTECTDSRLALRLRVVRGNAMDIIGIEEIGDRSIDAYFKIGAIALLEEIDPFVVAAYYFHIPDKRPEARQIANRLILERREVAAWAANLLGLLESREGRDENAMKWHARSIELANAYGPKDFAIPLNNWGVTLGDLGRHAEAIEKYRRATEVDPEYADAWNNWGNGLGALGRYAEAIEKYRRATELDPEYAYAWNNWGVTLGDLGRHAEAIEKYRRATEVDPEYADAWNGWGNRLGDLGRHAEAIEKYRRATELDPEVAYAWYNWGVTLGDLGRHAEAIEKYRRATELDPEDADAWNGWGNRLGDLGRHEEAIEKYRRATELDPEVAGAWNGWGNRLGDLGRHEEAIEKYRRATELDPEVAGAWINWGNRLGDLGRHAEAIEKYRRATELDPEVAGAWNNWAIVLANAGEAEEISTCSFLAQSNEYLTLAGELAPRWFISRVEGISGNADCT